MSLTRLQDLLRNTNMVVVDQASYNRAVVFGDNPKKLSPFLQKLVYCQDITSHLKTCNLEHLALVHQDFHAGKQVRTTASECCSLCQFVFQTATAP